jgi:hypothetical protein
MRPSRRAFLGATAVGGAAALGILRTLRGLERWLASPVLARTAPGPLSAPQVETLVAAASALAGRPLREEHYAAFFQWRAEHLPGHRGLYARFCATVDRAARRSEGRAFGACGAAQRRALLEPAFRARARAHASTRWLDRIFDREWRLYDRHIVSEALALFAATDAWLVLGYDAWPGTPRGFDRYRRPPG